MYHTNIHMENTFNVGAGFSPTTLKQREKENDFEVLYVVDL